MDGESQNFRRITMKVLTMQLNSTSVMDIVAYGGAAIGMAVAVSEFLKGNISVAGTLCIVLLASEFFLQSYSYHIRIHQPEIQNFLPEDSD